VAVSLPPDRGDHVVVLMCAGEKFGVRYRLKISTVLLRRLRGGMAVPMICSLTTDMAAVASRQGIGIGGD
jgi:hypothetical protein